MRKRIFLLKIIFSVYLFIFAFGMTFLPAISLAEFQAGANYSFDVFDFGTERLTGNSASGRSYGLNAGYFFNPWGIEIFAEKATLKQGFAAEGTSYAFAMEDFFWGIGGKKIFFVPYFYVRFGVSFHQLTATINDSNEAFDDLSDETLTPSTGSYMAPYVGVGVDYTAFSKYKIYSEASFYRFSQTTLYEWAFGLRYAF